MKYYIIAGEASGDLHGSNLVKSLRELDPAADIRGWGGDLMQAAGAVIAKHYRETAFMGFIEVVANLRSIMQNFRFCKQDIEAYQPDVLILIDYPGFNLRMAAWAKKRGLKVVYYISPQVWAWKEGRVKTIRKVVDKMLVILPFEKAFYQQHDYRVTYVGHPLAQVIQDFKKDYRGEALAVKPIIAVLPGSRKQEILTKLPIMLSVAQDFPGYQFIVAKAPSQDDALYAPFLAAYPNVTAVNNQTYPLLMQAAAALVTSGTATLETALFGVPEVVCYKGSSISYAIAKRLIKIRFISLVNLIMDREVVKELIQHELTKDNIRQELQALLHDEKRRKQIRQDYAALQEKLQEKTSASYRAAEEIVGLLQTSA